MTAELRDLGEWLSEPSVIVLCVAVLLRSPAAVRCQQQRGIWLAAASAALAMLLNLPSLTAFALHHGILPHCIPLAKNLLGVVSADAVLYFIASSTVTNRLLTTVLWFTTVFVTPTLLILAMVAGHGPQPGIPDTSDPLPSLAYWLVLMSTHLITNTLCVYVCWQYSGRAKARPLSASLRLFALGTSCASLYWIALLIHLTMGFNWPVPYMPLLMSMHGLLRAAAILTPLLLAVQGAASDVKTAWKLWPLWRDLVKSVPHVALTSPRTRIRDLLWPGVPRKLIVYRKVIEARDAILVLSDYIGPGVPSRARSHLAEAAIPEPNVDAAVLACVIRDAQQAKIRGESPQPHETNLFISGSGDLASEKVFLLELARAYDSTAVHSFTTR
ncbi:MAB_1171c family putative transporter [Streptomyces sp. WM6378]|uniref:MAB_1171c family putative transporter n=1 Tax=Streptomyces sp. WM6378 TaxID=1415557 RepID=UPI000ABD2074|nr:MAB_1171c family putative transporter [Streptomyces sp. WM6378]